jgi:hypothetical protein
MEIETDLPTWPTQPMNLSADPRMAFWQLCIINRALGQMAIEGTNYILLFEDSELIIHFREREELNRYYKALLISMTIP